MKKSVIIQGSSRSNGDTRLVVDYLNRNNEYDIIDLKTKDIGHFDYDFKNKNDDFILLMHDIINKYDNLVFATPVYWYSMSGMMKVFFDRISDLLKTHKELGRKLRGKNMAMISCSNSNSAPNGFSMPFEESAKYLGIQYLGDIHTWVDSSIIPMVVQNKVDEFRTKLLTSK